jgi:hypothetical protein
MTIPFLKGYLRNIVIPQCGIAIIRSSSFEEGCRGGGGVYILLQVNGKVGTIWK